MPHFPSRRTFIRTLGGSIVSAMLPPLLAGCSDDYPAEAVAAWRGPQGETGLRRWALAHAILSPNSHNRQPWTVDLRAPDAISLHVDRERLLPETDPWFRQIVVSQGTFLEALVMSLLERGASPVVQLFPEGEFGPKTLDDRPVAQVRWAPGETAARDPLFAQILRRNTAKVNYNVSRPVQASTMQALQSALVDPSVRCGWTLEPARRDALRELCWQAARVELLTPRTVMESVRLTRVGPDEIARHRDGISVNSTLPRIANAVGAFDRGSPPAEGSTAYREMMGRFEGHSRSAMGFVWLSTAAGHTPRADAVRAGRAYMRLQLKATELGLQVHPMSQAIQEFAEMQPLLDRALALTVGQPADRETVQMLCRVGHADAQQHSPRRALDSIVRKA